MKRVEEALIGTLVTYIKTKLDKFNEFKVTINSSTYDSVPVYATAKYNFKTNSDFTPYVKGDLGYSFNINLKKQTLTHEIDKGKDATEDLKNELTKRLNTLKTKYENAKVEAKNGLYAAASVGVEYKNFFAEIGGAYIGGAIETKYGNDDVIKTNTGDFKVTTNVGFKF